MMMLDDVDKNDEEEEDDDDDDDDGGGGGGGGMWWRLDSVRWCSTALLSDKVWNPPGPRAAASDAISPLLHISIKGSNLLGMNIQIASYFTLHHDL